ncbi:MAG: hypothetical protein AAB728_02375, partial [Patescibacteria group bacterium]
MFTVLPDYALTSPLSSPGSYALTVTPAENTGSPQAGQTLTAAVRVADGGRMLDIRRQSVTRTFPGNTEDMTVVVTPSATFIGSITERVPAGFDVVTVEPLANRTVEGDGSQTLSWERRWEANVPLTLRYTYRTPAQTPLFAAFGPLTAKGVKEVTGYEAGSSSSTPSSEGEGAQSSLESSASSEGGEAGSLSSASSSGESSSASPAPSSEASGVAESSTSNSSASSLGGARDDTSNGARDDTLTVSSEYSSSTSAETPLDSARGEAGSDSSSSELVPSLGEGSSSSQTSEPSALGASLFGNSFMEAGSSLDGARDDTSSEARDDTSSSQPEGFENDLLGNLFGIASDATAPRGLASSFWGKLRLAFNRFLHILSFFSPRTFIAAITDDESRYTFVAEEGRAWQVLSLPLPETSIAATDLTLTPKGSESFDANTLPAFTLLTGSAEGSGASLLDEDGHLRQEKALEQIVEAVMDDAAYKTEVVKTVVEGRKEEIAAALVQDSVAVNDIAAAAGIPEGRTKAQRVEEVIIAALEGDEGQKSVAEATLGARNLEDIVASALSPEMRKAVVRNIVAEEVERSTGREQGTGPLDSARGLRPLGAVLREQSATIADLASAAVVRTAWEDGETKRDIAVAILEAVRDQGPMTNDQGPMANDQAGGGSGAVAVGAPAVPAAPLFQVQLRDSSGRTFTPSFHFETGSLVLVIEPERRFAPGLYTLEVTVRNPVTGEEQILTQDFAWGVLAMNANQDTYLPGEKAGLAFGVLDDMGAIVCDASLTLAVTPPSGQTFTLSTEDNSIAVTGTCGRTEAGFIGPDYETFLTMAEEGTYRFLLTAITPNGTRSITNAIEVGSGFPFIIRREAATRLWPSAPSPMAIAVEFLEDFTGTVTET